MPLRPLDEGFYMHETAIPFRVQRMSLFDPWLRSDETGENFTHCIHCRLPLLELDSPWLVNKDFHKGECILEYAICEKCREQASEDFSEESKEAVRHFLEDERLMTFLHEPKARIENCISCNCPREHAKGYATSILLNASGEIDYGPLPLLLCSECAEQMSERLSEATRDSWRRFLNENFDSPPQLSSLPGLL